MIKKGLRSTLAVAGILAFSPISEGGEACCMKQANLKGKKECVATYAKLNLSAEQKAKLTTLSERCKKEGCTEASQAKFMNGAKKILSAGQFAQFKSECDKAQQTSKTQS